MRKEQAPELLWGRRGSRDERRFAQVKAHPCVLFGRPVEMFCSENEQALGTFYGVTYLKMLVGPPLDVRLNPCATGPSLTQGCYRDPSGGVLVPLGTPINP